MENKITSNEAILFLVKKVGYLELKCQLNRR